MKTWNISNDIMDRDDSQRELIISSNKIGPTGGLYYQKSSSGGGSIHRGGGGLGGTGRQIISSAHLKAVLILCSLANFINAADRVIMPIAIIQMSEEFHWNLHSQGWIHSTFSVGYLSSLILGGSAAKNYGGKLVLTISALFWSFSTFFTPIFSNSFTILIIFRVLLGFGEGLGLPTIFHIYAHLVPTEERSRAFGYLVAAASIGQTVTALICPHLPWRWSFYGFGFIGMVWVFAWLLLYKDGFSNAAVSTETSLVMGDIADVSGVLPSSSSLSSGCNPSSSGAAASNGSSSSSPSCFLFGSSGQLGGLPWREYFRYWPFWAIYAAHFSMNWSNYLIMQWLPTYLARGMHASPRHITYTALPYLANSVAGVTAGHVADFLVFRSSRPHLSLLKVRRLMTCAGLAAPGLFLLAFSSVHSIWPALLLVSLSMGFSACNAGGHLSNHAEVAPNHAGMTFAISNTLATVAGILCGPITAELVVQSGGRWFPVFILAGVMNFAGASIYLSQSAAHQIV